MQIEASDYINAARFCKNTKLSFNSCLNELVLSKAKENLLNEIHRERMVSMIRVKTQMRLKKTKEITIIVSYEFIDYLRQFIDDNMIRFIDNKFDKIMIMGCKVIIGQLDDKYYEIFTKEIIEG